MTQIIDAVSAVLVAAITAGGGYLGARLLKGQQAIAEKSETIRVLVNGRLSKVIETLEKREAEIDALKKAAAASNHRPRSTWAPPSS